MTRKHFYLLLIVITVAGLLLRLQVCRELFQNDVQVTRPSAYTDMATYKELSEKVADGKFSGDFYYQPFYYAVFLPAVHKLFGAGIWPVMIAQAVVSALTVFFASLCSAMLWGRKAAVFTALLAAFSSVLVLYVPYHLIETLQGLWVTLIMYSSLLAWKRGRTAYWAVAGFLVSLAILTRGNIWFFVPGLMAAAFFSVKFKDGTGRFSEPSKILARLVPAAVFLVMVILPQLPFAVRNMKVTGKFCGPSTAAGAVLALGNTPEAPPGGRNPGTGPGPMEYPETYGAWMQKEKEISVPSRILSWFKREPLAFVELQWRKMLLFWDSHEIPNNIAFEYQGRKSRTFMSVAFIPTSIILVGALAWIFYYLSSNAKKRFRRIFDHPQQLILLYLVIAFFLANVAFYILARFRLPCVPMLAVAAGGFAAGVMSGLGDWRNFAYRSVLPFTAAFLVVFFAFDFYRYSYESTVMKIARPDGVRSVLDGGKILYLDNGPLSFGSWIPMEIKSGISIRKKFALKDPMEGRSAEFAFPFTSETPGVMRLEINGKKVEFQVKQGMNEHLVEIPFDESTALVEIKFKYADCKACVIFDLQRNYGRTELDGKNPGGELVSKLYLVPRKE